MILYDAAWAPNPRRVRMFLAEKGIAIERRIVDLAGGENLREPFLSVNPRGTVPVLELDSGERIADSVAICRYLEALHPDPPLFGQDPLEIARIEAWTRKIEAEGYAGVVYAFRNRHKNMVDRALSGHWPAVPQLPELVMRGQNMWRWFVETLEEHLDGRAWIATDSYSFADLTALMAVDFAQATRLSDGNLPPALAAWHGRASARPRATA
ncbi:glutathione S-transferase [Sphingomonas changbaiensis NBRC 104936]|uniref:Glutathione S-transferase n=1 Tax=Sphingomonas changbaiensis NBRC 104936 TaxID=1219043 RepID=A0A0E9MTB5_9SPHN|nr:glutathione S-transferase N-terminal domain-containing protein [Sphingomonas changbaiensis]GAO40723.1 glutathione S-transferase [Sphingomonas changbaiensis NBRC 104936]